MPTMDVIKCTVCGAEETVPCGVTRMPLHDNAQALQAGVPCRGSTGAFVRTVER